MTFQSIEYLMFFPIVFLLYWIVGNKNKMIQNSILVIASLVFYGWWDWRFLGLLLFTAFSTYIAGLLMGNESLSDNKRRLISAMSILLNLGILFVYKYFNFFIESFIDLSAIFGITITVSTLNIILPVGISFYTFSALSYSIDVYQRKIYPTKDIIAYLAYVTFFPSILSGPINRANMQLPQYFESRSFDYNVAIMGCVSILWGGVMKLCLADRLGIYVDAVYGNISQHNGTTLLFASILYTIQIYADFAGYSLMAIGCGKLLGIDLQTNFIRPYFATTVTEFWRRWHISLTTWFRDYIYFPLGGNRCSKPRWILNTLIVFTVSGLWHGAAYAFLIWGVLHGLGMVVERLLYGNKLKQLSNKFCLSSIIRWVVTFMFVNIAWIPFRINDLNDVKVIIGKIFTDPGSIFIDANTLLMGAIAFVIVFIHDFIEEKRDKDPLLLSNYRFIRYASAVLIICYILAFGVLNGGSFIYFQF